MLAIILVLFSLFSPFGWQAIIVPLPTFSAIYFTALYDVLFLILYAVALPLGEAMFYFVFQANNWKGVAYDIMICVFYALANFAAFYFIIVGLIPQIVFSVLAGVFMFGYIYIRDKKSFFVAIGYRVGISMGITLWIFFFKYTTTASWVHRKQPVFFFPSNAGNIFTKLMG